MSNNRFNNNMKESDFEFIKENYEKLTVQEIANELKKCPSTIYKAISKLNLEFHNKKSKVWKDEEIQFLKDNYLSMNYSDIAVKINRDKKSVENKAHQLGLSKRMTSKTWTEEELEFLRKNINSMSYDEISLKLDRSIGAIYNKVYELQLISDDFKKSRKLKKEQIDFILNNYTSMTDHQLAIKFDVSAETVAAVRKKYGIYKNGNEIKSSTYIEDFVQKVLDDLKIEYSKNPFIGNYRPDFYIKDFNLIIEVQGDYFHCNPYLYKDGPKDDIQLKHIINDYYKKCFYLSSGYILLEIWEKDINEKSEEVINKIKSAVHRQGLQESVNDKNGKKLES